MISVENLTKYYGEFRALDDLTFDIEDGHVYGFLGPNGAGKTTTMNIITGCLSPTAGCVRIDGIDIFNEPKKAKRLIGYLPEQPPLYLSESAEEYLRFVGEAKGLKGRTLSQSVDDAIERTGLSNVRHRRISTLSKGYRQRVGIAQALMGNPKVIILDEPTVGLDPIQIVEIRDLIKSLGESHTVLLSSHILSEVQTICEKVLIISKGKLIAFDTPETLEKSLTAPGTVSITADCGEDTARDIIGNISLISDASFTSRDDGFVSAKLETSHENIYDVTRDVFRAFASAGTALLELTFTKANLEDIFIELTEDSGGEVPVSGETVASESPVSGAVTEHIPVTEPDNAAKFEDFDNSGGHSMGSDSPDSSQRGDGD